MSTTNSVQSWLLTNLVVFALQNHQSLFNYGKTVGSTRGQNPKFNDCTSSSDSSTNRAGTTTNNRSWQHNYRRMGCKDLGATSDLNFKNVTIQKASGKSKHVHQKIRRCLPPVGDNKIPGSMQVSTGFMTKTQNMYQIVVWINLGKCHVFRTYIFCIIDQNPFNFHLI